ncbi:DUF4333 domain-containing protein [Nocardia asteroides]|uniref:DUF4333 domain-containing protein n=1 Tax=Nocardia asteroides TaxID=1824 RepID=UPI001E329C0F|nr:DUF4333 domain-containing protein [Nocardia asteroides]UGT62941.1 DUF4333 domain-containing protein [Nocardia asteroides]
MSGPYGPSGPDQGRNDPTQQWGGQQPVSGAQPTQQWTGQPPSQAQPTQQWGGGDQSQQPQQQWGQSQPQWGQQQPQQSQPWGQQQPQQSQPQWQQPQPGQPQQPWGQPQQQWGQPQQPQQGGKGKGLLIGLVVGGLVVVGLIVALVLAVTATDKLDQAAVQDGVEKVLGDSYGIQDVGSVSCPSGQKVEVDAVFQCTVDVSGEQKTVQVKITRDDGTYEVGRPS